MVGGFQASAPFLKNKTNFKTTSQSKVWSEGFGHKLNHKYINDLQGLRNPEAK
jgi:hypothetical protein